VELGRDSSTKDTNPEYKASVAPHYETEMWPPAGDTSFNTTINFSDNVTMDPVWVGGSAATPSY
jgi:hypothetical protein